MAIIANHKIICGIFIDIILNLDGTPNKAKVSHLLADDVTSLDFVVAISSSVSCCVIFKKLF